MLMIFYRFVCKFWIVVILAFCTFLSCDTPQNYSNLKSPPTSNFSPDFLIKWWELIYKHVAYERIKPPVASRIYAYLGVSIYQAALPGMPEYQSLAGQINGLHDLPQPDPSLEYDWPTIIIMNTYASVDELLSRFVNADEQSFIQLRDKQLKERANMISDSVFQRSKKYGKVLGEALIQWIKEDQFSDTRYYTIYQPASRDIKASNWEPPRQPAQTQQTADSRQGL